MVWLIAGLVLFLGLHSIRRLAPQWREARIVAMGAGGWKGLYSVLSIAGFVLLIWGYGKARFEPLVMLWIPPPGMRHAAFGLTLLAFLSLAAAFVPRTHIRARFGHPMVLAIILWSIAHLLANGSRHDVLLFGSFLVWSTLLFHASYRSEPPKRSGGTWSGTLLALLVGAAAWAGFAYYLHERWIGVTPFA